MSRKHLLVLPIAAAFSLVGCSVDPPPPPVIITPTITETVTVIPPATNPPSANAKECVDNGVSTAGWNTERDVPSSAEMGLKAGDPITQPLVDAPLVGIHTWYGECFDSIEFIIDTRLNDPEQADRPWFDVKYVPMVRVDGSGHGIVLDGMADLQVVIFAPGDSWHYGEPDRPVQPIDASNYRRVMNYDFDSVEEVQGAGDFEGVVTFGIGVNEKRPFAVEYNDNHDGTTSVVVRVKNG